MAYRALYRVYRPRTFADMVGQEVITKTLANAIKAHQTGHAYLFSGPRGTGKTSAAKIFAREVNGIDPKTDDSQIPDIIEIDAASNNGVDEIRNIRDSANYAPIEAPYKIYIIDEAHMLSTGAFNALLKTLEEPPAKVKFILATTEPQKMPATILSRTQRFEFKRISDETLEKRMAYILKEQGVAYEDEALRIIAKAAEGGMRDALSILDQVIAFQPDKITAETALEVTGSVQIDQLMQYLSEVSQGQTAAALEDLSHILAAGKDARRFLLDLIQTLRDVMLADITPDLIHSTASLDDLKKLGQLLTHDKIQKMMLAIDDMQKQLQSSVQSDVYLELLTVKLATDVEALVTEAAPAAAKATPARKAKAKAAETTTVPNPEPVLEVTSQVAETLSTKDEAPQVPAESQPEPDRIPEVQEKPKPAAAPQEESQPAPAAQPAAPAKAAVAPIAYTGQKAVFAVLGQAQRDALQDTKRAWGDLLGIFAVNQQALLQTAEPVAASRDALVLAFDYPALMEQALQDGALQSELHKELEQAQLPSQLVMISQDQWRQERSEYVKELKSGQTSHYDLNDLEPVQANATTAQMDPAPAPTEAARPETEAEKQAGPDIVQEAQDLFGPDLVQVVDHSQEDR
ncbi:DNA polymerase III subunit gamma/tau [Eupransor demetentiae]|uniref:DNA-directed DNA polymerase n=1 Tax=Eupransor demetentiae TaxID=3109584 RepID=A0ABM9N5G0_9LACO|nr:DNA polymerase III [Lactobacillaceae bacterium LMG 33000]